MNNIINLTKPKFLKTPSEKSKDMNELNIKYRDKKKINFKELLLKKKKFLS